MHRRRPPAAVLALALLAGLAPSLTAASAQDPATPQASEAAALEQAAALVQARDFGRALPLLERLTAEHPDSGRAWLLLGRARHASGAHAGALEALEQAAGFDELRAAAGFEAARACSRLGRPEQALEWLERARAAGFDDVARMARDPDLAPLGSEPRFEALLPIGAPARFVEDVRVLLELRAEGAGDRYGWIGRNAGDVDEDGVADILLSAPFRTVDGAPGAGRIYLHSGRTGELIYARDGTPGSQLGIGIENAGDVNGDGVPDQLAGANQAGGRGAAYVWSGADGELLLDLSGERPGDEFGRKVAGAGDQDGDGFDDVIVGAPNHASAGPNAGRAYVFSGRTGEVILQLDGERAGDQFGRSVDAYSQDGLQLLIVGAANAGETNGGRVSVYRVEDGEPREAFRIESGPGDRNLGMMFVSAVGDVNGDGVVDVYASDWNSDAGGIPGAGRVYVHSGADGSRLHELAGDAPGIGFGIGTAEAGDVDGDGCDDLLIGAWQDGTGATAGGRCTLYSGKTGAVLATYTCTTPGDTFGYDTTGLGDVDGDGAPDFLITSAGSFVSGVGSGRVLVIAGPAAGASESAEAGSDG